MGCHNLIPAPGSHKRKVVRGRGKYGHHGRTCGYGNGGIKKRGRRHLNPWYEGGHQALAYRTPKLTQEQMKDMRTRKTGAGYTPLFIKDLNKLEDGDEVEYMDLFVRGIKVKPHKM